MQQCSTCLAASRGSCTGDEMAESSSLPAIFFLAAAAASIKPTPRCCFERSSRQQHAAGIRSQHARSCGCDSAVPLAVGLAPGIHARLVHPVAVCTCGAVSGWVAAAPRSAARRPTPASYLLARPPFVPASRDLVQLPVLLLQVPEEHPRVQRRARHRGHERVARAVDGPRRVHLWREGEARWRGGVRACCRFVVQLSNDEKNRSDANATGNARKER